jgi:hypothetical protein
MTRKLKDEHPTPPDPGESIGRPDPWQEGRYEKSDAPGGDSVLRKPGEGPTDTVSTPVTRDDYERLGPQPQTGVNTTLPTAVFEAGT